MLGMSVCSSGYNIDVRRYANGERYVRPKSGYVTIVINGKHLLEHRYMWEQAYGPIPPKHDVHHKNHIRADNRLENFELLDWREHRRLHAPEGGRTPRTPERIAKWRATMATKPRKPRAICTIGGCEEIVNGYGYCLLHYMRARRHGNPLAEPIPQQHRALKRGEAQHSAKLTEETVRMIRKRHHAGETLHSLATEFGVSRPTLSDLVTGRTWKHVS
jgi:HNH endonuclease